MKDTNRILDSVIRNDNLFVSARLCNEKRLKRKLVLLSSTWVLQLTTCEILLVANLNPVGQQMMG